MKKILVSDVKANLDTKIDDIYKEFECYPWHVPQAYADYLAQVYFYVCHATRVLAYAAAKTPVGNSELHDMFLKGAREEKDHEFLAENDLKHLGFSLSNFEEITETSAYYQTLYYTIGFWGSEALLGYFLTLEGLAATKLQPTMEKVETMYGKQTISFLEEHIVLDKDHYAETLTVLDNMSEQQLNIINKAVTYSADLYIRILKELNHKYSNMNLGLNQNKGEVTHHASH